MNDLLHWITADDPPGTMRDLRWAWLTLSLAGLVAAGYVVTAVNRYFQAKLGRAAEAKASLARLRNVLLAGCVLGVTFAAAWPGWAAWRVYDLALLALAAYTWWGVGRTRGIGLVDERLAQLEHSAEKYRQMAEFLPDIVWTATGDGTVDFCNRRWAEYVGDHAGATGATSSTWLDAAHPDDRAGLQSWWAAVVTGRTAASREVRLRSGAGAYRTFIVRAAPITCGDAVRWLGACSDVEDQKRLASEKEEQAKRKTFFLNALSHDLRAPLNIMALNAHLLKTSAREEADAESAKLIIDHATAAGTLLTKALELAKADAEDHNVVEPVCVADLLEGVARRFGPVAEQKGLSLRVAAPAGVVVHTDRQKLDRIVTNLVDNALKFTEHGGVTLETSAAAGELCVAVIDTGPGVPPENAPHLFEEFYQAGDSRVGGGFGMGLAICRFLARQLGGDVRLAHANGSGSRFELTVRDVRPRPGTGTVAEEVVGSVQGDALRRRADVTESAVPRAASVSIRDPLSSPVPDT